MVEHHDALTIKVSNGLVQLAIFILHYFILKGLLAAIQIERRGHDSKYQIVTGNEMFTILLFKKTLNVRICQKRTVKCLFLLFQITLKCKL
jgi:hypothetical protein